jgi:hypothetical protein
MLKLTIASLSVGVSRAGKSARHFIRDESGAVLAFILPLFLIIVVVSGGAVDFMRHETERARLQSSLDRGVLAAAAFSQDVDAEDTVGAYLASSGVPEGVDINVVPAETMFTRRVDASAEYPFNTFFLKIIGINTLQVVAQSAAEQRRKKVEVSVVLDISPSMADNSKMTRLRAAANSFVDTLLNNDSMEYTSISLIPFGGMANPGANLFARYNVPRLHNYSSCIEFADTDFNTTAFIPTVARTQVIHFNWAALNLYPAGTSWGWCPNETSAALVFSNSLTDLHNKINTLGMHEATGIQNGLKWGAALLDPGTRPAILGMANLGQVNAIFNNRPADWTDQNTLKFAVVMTDGEITLQYRVKASEGDTASERTYWASTTHPLGQESSRATTKSTQPQSLDQLNRMCAATKAKGIVLFTIGFEVNDTSANTLKACATTNAHFYRVEGLQIQTAFASIARTIQNLKLVQ